ncbi:hypothetical protein TSOC_004816 [Tetrabaena socialis]|uniref:Coenzyme Q-binding protein COQ10 START domain-containing protein n=1 Tax=Tetrabaena socialis TaxID=47790 RepID=A0A2J8A7Z5_9CHLO|nr:hypothetical protein TSOC_004816 [Tetrabaena socialis]|eukprot:PNH08610.1 hypothetical protein TSOC_004816 [Tetrabaena socialis]
MTALGTHRGCSAGAGARARGSRVRGDVRARATTASGVRIDVENTSWNSRRIFASVAVAAPKAFVWSALTDYDNLARFIPSLVENRCVERSGDSAVLYQAVSRYAQSQFERQEQQLQLQGNAQ